MAQQKRSRSTRTARSARSSRPSRPAKKASPPRRRQAEFRPDRQGTNWFKKLYVTQLQRITLLKWGSYILLLILLLVIQDVIMSKITIFGTTTDLVTAAILLITVMEGTDTGSLFVLVASALFYFSGSAPGPYSVALITILGIGACMFRQLYWHRSRGSIVLCAGLALVLYELSVYGVGIFLGLTYWGRFTAFLGTGLLSWLVMVPLYSLINVIGQIGGNTWKE